MNPIRVDTAALNAQASELDRLQDELARLSDMVSSISSSLSWRIPGGNLIRGKLALKQLQLNAQRTRAAALAAGLRNVSSLYGRTESRIVSGEAGPADVVGQAIGAITGGVNAIIGTAVPIVAPIEISYGEWKDKKAFNDSLMDKNERKKLKKEYDGYQKNEDEDWYEKNATILEGKREKKVEVYDQGKSVEGEARFAQGSAEYKVGDREAHASAQAGLYVYEKDADGNTKRIFSPGVGAEAGASFAILSASAEGRVGLGEDNNMFGAYGSVEGELVSGEAEAKLSANLAGKEVYGKLSAEFNAAKVEGSAGVSVLGTDIGVTGAAKIGLGAHAEAGFTDGKLKVDIGAAVGIGFDVGFEIDVSGTIDAVCSFAKGLFNW